MVYILGMIIICTSTNAELTAMTNMLTAQVAALTATIATVHHPINAYFTLSPGHIKPQDTIDYGTKFGQIFWHQSTRALPDVTFDLRSQYVVAFLELLTSLRFTTLLIICHCPSKYHRSVMHFRWSISP